MQKSHLNIEDANGELIARRINCSLVFPAGNKFVYVQVKLTDSTLSITHTDADPNNDRVKDYDNSDSDGDAVDEFDVSIAKMIENKQNLNYFSVPIGMIESAKIVELSANLEILLIKTKDFRTIALLFDEKSDLNSFYEDIIKTVFVDIHDDDIFLNNYFYVC
jgi:hypothetical protein